MDLAAIDAPDVPLDADDITRVLIYIPKHAFEVADPRANLEMVPETMMVKVLKHP